MILKRTAASKRALLPHAADYRKSLTHSLGGDWDFLLVSFVFFINEMHNLRQL